MPRDLYADASPREWLGLEFDSHVAPRRGPPTLRVEYASWHYFRVRHDARTLLLARRLPYWSGLWWARADTTRASLAVIPPLRIADARALRGDLRAWAWRFRELLEAQPATLLHPGTWRIEPPTAQDDSSGVALVGRGLEQCLQAPPGLTRFGLRGSGAVYALRDPSAPEAARVKAWRKCARDGTLPPLLLWFVSGMDSWLLVDGHDRLRAAMLEGVAPSFVLLSSVRTERWPDDPEARERIARSLEEQAEHAVAPLQVAGLNRRWIDLYRDPAMTVSRTRAWPIAGGRAGWLAEARELVARGAPAGLVEAE